MIQTHQNKTNLNPAQSFCQYANKPLMYHLVQVCVHYRESPNRTGPRPPQNERWLSKEKQLRQIRRQIILGQLYIHIHTHTCSIGCYYFTHANTHGLLTELIMALARRSSHYSLSQGDSTPSIFNTVKARSFQQEEFYCI